MMITIVLTAKTAIKAMSTLTIARAIIGTIVITVFNRYGSHDGNNSFLQ